MSLIEDIKRDREAGTPGRWDAALERGCHGVIGRVLPEGGANFVALIGNDATTEDREPARFANARRIARVPQMEAALLAADALAKEADRVCSVLRDDNGHAPCSLELALASYREAIQ